MQKAKHIFIIQYDEDESIAVGRKADVDDLIRTAEENATDLGFKTIGRIAEPLDLDFPPSLIEWYDGIEPDKSIVDRTIMIIINYLKH